MCPGETGVSRGTNDTGADKGPGGPRKYNRKEIFRSCDLTMSKTADHPDRDYYHDSLQFSGSSVRSIETEGDY